MHIFCTAHTMEKCGKSAHCTVPYCANFNRSLVKLHSFTFQKGDAKRTELLKNICAEKAIAFVKSVKFYNFRWSAWSQDALLMILRLLPAIQVLVARRDLKHLCTELMADTGLLTLLLDTEGNYKKESVAKADADHDNPKQKVVYLKFILLSMLVSIASILWTIYL